MPVPVDAPTVKLLKLPQGDLAQFFNGEPAMHYIAAIALRPGSLRGNHYHLAKEEWVYLIRGVVELVVEDIRTKERASVELQAGDLAIIHTGIAHALRPSQDGEAIEFSPAPFDAGDIHRYPLG